MNRNYALALALAFGTACAGNAADEGSSNDALYSINVQEGADSISGTLDMGDQIVEFASTNVGDGVVDLWIEANGLRVTGLFDPNLGVVELDGYAAADGTDTMVTAADHGHFLALARALDVYGEDVPLHIDMLRSYADVWGEQPPTIELQRQMAYSPRSWTSICSKHNTWYQATYDCSHGGLSTDATTAKGYVAHTSSYSCSADGTKWKKTSADSVQCKDPEPSGNATWEFAKGNCWGRCGGGCGSSKRYTKQCAQHDLCVRSGHSTASIYCDDEFTAASDDAISATKCSW